MSDNRSTSRNVSYDQVKTIIDFMGQHVDFATGSLRSLEARQTSKTLWNELSRILNESRMGTTKTSDGWSKYWSDFKNKLKNKVSVLKKKRPGATSSRNNKPLTRLEKRALIILGPHFERKITKVPKHCFRTNYPAEVKLEGHNEIGHHLFANNVSESSDRQSDEETNDSEESNGELDDNLDEEHEPILHSIYPKWLIEIEKKHAEAELIRAKAEEQRANVGAKNSEAFLVQAEALKKLADAAVLQADALAKIAGILDNNALRQIVPF